MNIIKKEIMKAAIGTPIGYCTMKVATKCVSGMLPPAVGMPMKIMRMVGTAGIGMVAASTVQQSVDQSIEYYDAVKSAKYARRYAHPKKN